jgi:hypothetical protein
MMFSYFFPIGNANNFLNLFPPTETDHSSFDKRNRKKRAAKATSPEKVMLDIIIDSYILSFHNDHLTRNRFKKANPS